VHGWKQGIYDPALHTLPLDDWSLRRAELDHWLEQQGTPTTSVRTIAVAQRLETPRCKLWLYRPCTASFSVGSVKRLGDLAILKRNARMIWRRTGKTRRTGSASSNSYPLMIQRLGSLPPKSSGTWSATQISRTHARWRSSEILTPAFTSFYFPFSSTGEKNEFLHLVRSNEDMGKGLSFLLSLNTYRRWTNSTTAWLTSWARSCWVQ